ncbi:hypothetical protein T11_5990 [Trichinella zimbabwensis]|uniref:Uncharacterized protein n=1 Tax=Trichinella zimbabwensis TaxID=268475 RepID=A0A0V1HB19_9BILA|nr:hypothetical protein T11_5990 [Trichinella zimbabwensis]
MSAVGTKLSQLKPRPAYKSWSSESIRTNKFISYNQKSTSTPEPGRLAQQDRLFRM